MKCPRCDHEIELAWEALRRGRNDLGLCVECGKDAGGFYRCEPCRVRIAARKRQREILEQSTTEERSA